MIIKILLYIYICSSIIVFIYTFKDTIDDFKETNIITKDDIVSSFLLWIMTGLPPVFNTWFAFLVLYDKTRDIINYLKK